MSDVSEIDPVAAVVEAIRNKSPEHIRRKTDKENYSIEDLHKAVQVLKEIDEKDSNGIPDAKTLEAAGELEDKILRNWIIKLAIIVVFILVVAVAGGVIYSTITGNDILVPNFVSGTFGTIKDIVTVIIDTKG